MVATRKPSRINGLFLREVFLKCKLNKIVLKRLVDFNTNNEFLSSYFKSIPNIHNEMCEFFQHGFIMGDFDDSFLNIYVGELQIRSFVSLLQNQVEWGKRVNEYTEV
jgi:hypothetical protein